MQHFADALHVSPAYLSDMLRSLTGQNTQQHIHQALIELERAKGLLFSTSLSINETVFKLGFEYLQYFTHLFKSKTRSDARRFPVFGAVSRQPSAILPPAARLTPRERSISRFCGARRAAGVLPAHRRAAKSVKSLPSYHIIM